jgi:YaiO family outer membrane protein
MKRLLAAIASLVAVTTSAEQLPRSEYSLWTSSESLNKGLSDWQESGMQFQHLFSHQQNWYANARQTRRFSLRDNEFGLGTSLPLTTKLTASADATLSETHRVLPRSSLQLQMQSAWMEGYGTWVGFRRSRYQQADTDLFIAGVERYVGDYRFAYTLYLADPGAGGHASSHRIQATRYAESWSLGASLARGREVENIGGTALLVSDIRYAGIQAAYRFASQSWLNLDVGEHRQGSLYSRRGARLAVRLGF